MSGRCAKIAGYTFIDCIHFRLHRVAEFVEAAGEDVFDIGKIEIAAQLAKALFAGAGVAAHGVPVMKCRLRSAIAITIAHGARKLGIEQEGIRRSVRAKMRPWRLRYISKPLTDLRTADHCVVVGSADVAEEGRRMKYLTSSMRVVIGALN